MLYYNTQPIFWNNQSLEKPDNALINSSYYNDNWVLLGTNVAYSMNLLSLTFNIGASNTNFNTNYKWYKFVDNANHVFYYFLESFSLNGSTYVVTLSLDIWSTYISQFFDSSNLTDTHYVYFNQKQKTNNNLWFKPLQKETYLFNIYADHQDLSTITTNHWSDSQNQTDWGMINTYNYNSSQVTYYTFLYKVNLMSSAEDNITMVPNLTYISFSPVANHQNGLGWQDGYWSWWQNLQDTTNYDLDLVELPFDLTVQDNVFHTQEYNWTANSNIQNATELNCYYCDYNGIKLNISFPFLTTASQWLGNLNGTLTEEIAFNAYVGNEIGFYWTLGNIVPFSFLEIAFPYLINFRIFSLSYMLQEYSFNVSNFSQINYFFSPNSWVINFVPNYPTLMLNIHINPYMSYTGMSTLIGSFNFMNANITNTLSAAGTFLSQNKNVIQTAHSIVQNQSNLEWTNAALSSVNIWNDITHPFETADKWTNTALNNQNLWRQYSMSYGKARLSQLRKSNSMSSAGTNNGLVANILFLNNTILQEFEVIKVVEDIDKFGYIYDNWDYLNSWYVKYFHNFVKITMGLEKVFTQSIPNSLVNTCLEMLSNGVIIWSNLFNNDIQYFNVNKIFKSGIESSNFSNFVYEYYYNAEKDFGGN